MKPEMLQLTQRLSVTTFLDPLDAEEVARYIRHRLGVAGYPGKPLFTPEALQLVAQESQGIPRNINNICFGAMSMAFGLHQKKIDREIVESVAADQNLKSLGQRAILLEHQRARSQRPELPETSARTAQTAGMQRRSIPSGIGRYARVTACLLAFLLLLTPSMATGAQPATRVLVSAENRSISVATTLRPKFEATALESSVAKTGPAIQVGLPNRSSDDHVAVVGPRQTLRQICLRYVGRYSLRTVQQIQALNSGLDPNRIEIGQRIRLPLSPAPQNSTRSLLGEREGQPIVALAK